MDENNKNLFEMTVDATLENLDKVIQFVEEHLERVGCLQKIKTEIDVAVDEIFANISSYAYSPKVGDATIKIEFDNELKEVEITFIDSGKPYNPLEKEDPDVTLPLEKRKIGGLGIYMVKKSMDDMKYEYKNNHNILKIKKKLKKEN